MTTTKYRRKSLGIWSTLTHKFKCYSCTLAALRMKRPLNKTVSRKTFEFPIHITVGYIITNLWVWRYYRSKKVNNALFHVFYHSFCICLTHPTAQHWYSMVHHGGVPWDHSPAPTKFFIEDQLWWTSVLWALFSHEGNSAAYKFGTVSPLQLISGGKHVFLVPWYQSLPYYFSDLKAGENKHF